MAGEADQAHGQPGSEKWVTWRDTIIERTTMDSLGHGEHRAAAGASCGRGGRRASLSRRCSGTNWRRGSFMKARKSRPCGGVVAAAEDRHAAGARRRPGGCARPRGASRGLGFSNSRRAAERRARVLVASDRPAPARLWSSALPGRRRPGCRGRRGRCRRASRSGRASEIQTCSSRSSGRRGFIVPSRKPSAPFGVRLARARPARRRRSARARRSARREQISTHGAPPQRRRVERVAGERGQLAAGRRAAFAGVAKKLGPEADRDRHPAARISALGESRPSARRSGASKAPICAVAQVRARDPGRVLAVQRRRRHVRPIRPLRASFMHRHDSSPPTRHFRAPPRSVLGVRSGHSFFGPVTYEIDAPPRPAVGRSLPSWPTGRPLRAWQQAAAARGLRPFRRGLPRLRDARCRQDHLRAARRPPDALRGARVARGRRRADDPHLPPVGAGRRPLRHPPRAQPAQLRRARAARPPRRGRHLRDRRRRVRTSTAGAAPSGRRC